MERTPTLWEQIWLAQGKRCAVCNKEVLLENTAKNTYSFKIVCQDCYSNPRLTTVIMDELADY